MRPIDRVPSVAGPELELNRYLAQLQQHSHVVGALAFWNLQRVSFPLLAPLAQDLVSAPAWQAFVERIFSVTGMILSWQT